MKRFGAECIGDRCGDMVGPWLIICHIGSNSGILTVPYRDCSTQQFAAANNDESKMQQQESIQQIIQHFQKNPGNITQLLNPLQ